MFKSLIVCKYGSRVQTSKKVKGLLQRMFPEYTYSSIQCIGKILSDDTIIDCINENNSYGSIIKNIIVDEVYKDLPTRLSSKIKNVKFWYIVENTGNNWKNKPALFPYSKDGKEILTEMNI